MRRFLCLTGFVVVAACEPVPTVTTTPAPAGIPECSGPARTITGNVAQRLETCRDGQRVIVVPRPVSEIPPAPAVTTTPLPPAGQTPAPASDVPPVIMTDPNFAPEAVPLGTPAPAPAASGDGT